MLAASFVPAAEAASLDGSIRLAWTETDLADSDVSSRDHGANLSLTQLLTPYLMLRFHGRYGEQATAVDGDETASRTSLQPSAELLYGRPGLSWRVGWENRRVDELGREEAFESNALTSSLYWQPRSDLRLNLGYREATNESDVSALGRDLDERNGSLDLTYQRRFWSVGYSASYDELEGGTSDIYAEQVRQDLRLQASRDFADGRLRLGFSGAAGRIESERLRTSGEVGDPLPAAQGLFAIDASPSIGELAPAPGLIDGDISNATTPAIEIGGGNTFRNLGIDLGVPLPATRLEIVVDRPSGSQVDWEVYASADGVVWDPVFVVSREYDATLLRYRLRFPQVEQRFLKAVNVSVNPEPDVRVTELRALRELASIDTPDRGRETYRVGANLGWRVAPRVHFDAGADASSDSTAVGGVVRRDLRTSGFRAGVQVDLRRDLRLDARFRRSESEERLEDGLTRSTDDVGVSLRWTPLPTVDAILTASTRTDSDEERELSRVESLRLAVSLDLLDELRLVTNASFSRLDGAAVARTRDTMSWAQRVEMRPYRGWRVSSGYTWSRTEGVGGEGLEVERRSLFADVDWSPGSALTLRGTLHYSDDTRSSALRQSFALFWTPGPKLAVSLAWDEYSQEEGALTANDSLSVTYQLASRMQLFASISRSRSETSGGESDEFTSAHAGTSLTF